MTQKTASRVGLSRGELARTGAAVPFLLVLIGIGSAPAFLLPSGMPQPSDAFLLLAGVALVLRYKNAFDARTLRVAVPALVFFMYAICVDIAFFFVRGDSRFLLGASYIAFNAAVFVGVFAGAVADWNRLSRSVLRGTVFGVIGLLLSIPWTAGQFGTRLSLSFDNPNQLGYFALLSIAMASLVWDEKSVGAFGRLVFGLGAIFLVVLSLSKAAILGVAALLSFSFMRLSAQKRFLWLVIAVASLTLAVTSGLVEKWTVLSGLVDRISAVGSDADDNLEARGYGRISSHPGYLLLGAGDSGHERWGVTSKSELHSSWGTVVFGYGVIGSMCLGLWMLLTGMRGGLRVLPALSAVGLYGLTHQGLRQPQLWVVLALATVVATRVQQSRRDCES